MENNNKSSSDITPEQRDFFVERYDFIYKELNRIQDNMSKMEIEATKLLFDLQALREKEKEITGE